MSDCRFGVSPVNYLDPDPDVLANRCLRWAHKSIAFVGHRLIFMTGEYAQE